VINVVVNYPTGQQLNLYVDRYPDECPVCHTSVQPIFLTGRTLDGPPSYAKADLAFQCTKHGCQSVFIGRYRGNSHAMSPTVPFVLESIAPKHAQKTKFSGEIEVLSPKFVEVYNQAMAAEGAALDQLVGMGLRKALEFLVKDLAISEAANDEEKAAIKKRQLAQVIQEHITDATVQAAAKRATWLANDETHYERRWEDKDIKDVKALVRLTVNAVENAIQLGQYVEDMPEGKKV
jgi:hypothetical protein